MEIRDSVFVVTGGGSGLGAATARHLVEQGAKVVLADRMGCLKGGVVANRVVPTAEYVRFATHYRFRPDFCEAADPESKGIVERRNGFFETSFMPGRHFESPDDFNAQFTDWLSTANTRTVRTIKARPVDLLPADTEAMLALPPAVLHLGWRNHVRLGRDYYVRVDTCDYSVDPRAIGVQVDVAADLDTVRVRHGGRLVAEHPRLRQVVVDGDAEAEAVVAKDRESNQRDLYDAIERGDFPKWTMYVQIMPEADAEKVPYHPFDLTKVWPKGDYPLIEVGEFELNRNPENFFLDVEQSAFAPSNLVPGISVSPDRMLQARLFNYADAQRYRLGVNYQQIPVNKARCPVHSNHRDGQGRVDANYGSTLHYEPNSFGQWQEQPEFKEPPLKITGDADFWNYREDDDDYFSQPRALFRLMTPEQQQVLFDNTARAMGDAPDFIKQRHIDNCTKCDPAYGAGVKKALGL